MVCRSTYFRHAPILRQLKQKQLRCWNSTPAPFKGKGVLLSRTRVCLPGVIRSNIYIEAFSGRKRGAFIYLFMTDFCCLPGWSATARLPLKKIKQLKHTVKYSFHAPMLNGPFIIDYLFQKKIENW